MGIFERIQIENFKYLNDRKLTMIFKEVDNCFSLWGKDDNGVMYELVKLNKNKKENK